MGCGYGYYTHYFDGIGAQTIGVDEAEKMIQIAKNKYPHSIFSIVDLTNPLPFEDASFEMVFCNQVLMDIEKIDNVINECFRVLKNNGIFYYSIVHPAFYNGDWRVDENGYKYAIELTRYLTPCDFKNIFWGETTHFHRPLSEYLNAAAKAGFALKHTEEPKSYDGILKNDDLPLFFFAEYEKL